MYYNVSESDYYMWLLGHVGVSRSVSSEYSKLLETLFSTEFIYAFVMDANRAEAGKNLRGIYAMEVGIDEQDVLTGPCTVFEMLVALADDFSNFSGREISNCFWELLRNLGLDTITNDCFDKDYILNILYNWMGHCYQSNGTGGLFPLRSYNGDVRNMEIWNQMNAYILENYPID